MKSWKNTPTLWELLLFEGKFYSYFFEWKSITLAIVREDVSKDKRNFRDPVRTEVISQVNLYFLKCNLQPLLIVWITKTEFLEKTSKKGVSYKLSSVFKTDTLQLQTDIMSTPLTLFRREMAPKIKLISGPVTAEGFWLAVSVSVVHFSALKVTPTM